MRSRIGGMRMAMTAIIAMALALSLTGMPARGESVQAMSPVQATLSVQTPGALVAKGVAVEIDLEYRCLSGALVHGAYVSVRERVGNGIAFGQGEPLNIGQCTQDGSSQYVTVLVPSYNRPFKPGIALVMAELFGVDGFGNFFVVTDEREVKLTK
jgi:hypothetical protein